MKLLLVRLDVIGPTPINCSLPFMHKAHWKAYCHLNENSIEVDFLFIALCAFFCLELIEDILGNSCLFWIEMTSWFLTLVNTERLTWGITRSAVSRWPWWTVVSIHDVATDDDAKALDPPHLILDSFRHRTGQGMPGELYRSWIHQYDEHSGQLLVASF